MSLSKKDPSLRVAANDPHLVSLGGGRLSTAVTIHNIPVGDCTIGSSTNCSVTLCGLGVKPVHCTIYRSEGNQVTLVPEQGARILIDGEGIKSEVDLRQGAMITVGDSYYLRYNNPAEALQMRTAIEDVSENDNIRDLDYFYDINIKPDIISRQPNKSTHSVYDNLEKIQNTVDAVEWQCPKVFSSDSVTVNMPARDVLGHKYVNFARNLVENHRRDKNVAVLNPNVCVKNNWEYLNRVNNTLIPQRANDTRYRSLEINPNEDPLEDMLKICAEYIDSEDYSYNGGIDCVHSSPIIQNRIKTNGSLPRDKTSRLYQELSSTHQCRASNHSQSSKILQNASDYETIQEVQQKETDITENIKSSRYENVKLVPQSPRTKIRTNYMSPKKELTVKNFEIRDWHSVDKPYTNYEYLTKYFGEKFEREIGVIKDGSISPLNTKKSHLNNSSPLLTKRVNKNVNNLTIDIKSFISPYNSPQLSKKPIAALRTINKTKIIGADNVSNLLTKHLNFKKLHEEREDMLQRIRCLKDELNSFQRQDDGTLIDIDKDMENALVLAELQSLRFKKEKLQQELKSLHQKTHRLEAQRNATRIIEENQQSKLKHSIEMKQDQVEKLNEILKQKCGNMCLKEELANVRESLENDKKSFEDLEFQYLEGESEWQSYREDLNLEEQTISKQIDEYQLTIENLEYKVMNSNSNINLKQRRLSYLVSLIRDLQQCEDQFNLLAKSLNLITDSNTSLSEQGGYHVSSHGSQSQITQSLFGSTEMLCLRDHSEDLMSKNVNDNIFLNSKIKVYRNSLNSKEAKGLTNCHGYKFVLHDTIKEIERKRKLLIRSKDWQNLDYEKRKIEEILLKLKSDGKQESSWNASDLSLISQNQCSNNHASSSISFNDFKHNSEILSNIIQKSFNELSISSVDSPTSFIVDKKRSSSVLSNELSSFSSKMTCERKQYKNEKPQRPLTRYLPIYSEYLDLKHHIESAGHPLSLCPHIFINKFSCRGYLHKLGSTFHTWSKRWFVLDRQRCTFIYYSDKSEQKPRGGAYFSSIDEVYMDHLNLSKSSRPHSTFIVKTKKRSYYLQGASDIATRIWIDAIITGAQGNTDY